VCDVLLERVSTGAVLQLVVDKTLECYAGLTDWRGLVHFLDELATLRVALGGDRRAGEKVSWGAVRAM
jgi:hypothetical protein